MNVTLLRHPTEDDWMLTKTCALNTIGKDATKLPSDEWKVAILKSEHSPIRTLQFAVKMEIPYWVSVHFVRHKIGVEHFVQTQRNDRQKKYDRETAPQNQMVSHIMYFDAQGFINMCHARLCNLASDKTHQVMQMIVDEVLKTNPEFKEVAVPKCVYRGGLCTEFKPCGKVKVNNG